MAFGLPVSTPGGEGSGGGPGGGFPTTTTANFTQPLVGSTVVVPVSAVAGAVVGGAALVGGGGGAYAITAIGGSTLTLANLGSSGGVTNAAPTTVIASGSSVVYDGPATRLLSTGDLTFTVAGDGYDVTPDVQSISGAGGAGGTVPVNVTTLQIAAGIASPVWGQAPAATPPTQSWTLRPQGSLVIDLQVPPTGGAVPFIDGRYEGNHAFMLGMPFGSDAFSGLWLFSPNLAQNPTGDNYTLEMKVGGGTVLNAPFSNLQILMADNPADSACPIGMNASGWQFFSTTVNFGSGEGVVSLRKATTNPTVDMPSGYVGYYCDGASEELQLWTTYGKARLPVLAPLTINGALTTAIFIDPANSTTHASDANPGTALAPLATLAYLNGQFPFKSLTANTTITFLSDDASASALDWTPLDRNGFNLTIVGTDQVLHTGGTLDAGTVTIDPAASGGGQSQVVHTSDVSAWGIYIVPNMGGTAADGVRLVDTSGGNTGTTSWICDTRAGDGVPPNTSQPTNAGLTAPGTLTIGEGYKLVRGSHLRLAAQPPLTNNGGNNVGVTLSNFAFVADSVGAPDMNCNRCSFAGPIPVDCFLTDCFAAAGVSAFALGEHLPVVDMNAGVWASGGDLCESIILSANCYVGGQGITLHPVGVRSLFVQGGNALGTGTGTGAQVMDTQSARAGVDIYGGTSLNLGIAGAGLLWGNGNQGAGIAVEHNVSGLVLVTVTAAVATSVTGSGGDIFFTLPDGSTLTALAYAWDPTTAAYITPPRATTYANLNATIAGGGFGGHMHRPDAGSHLIAV